MIRWRAIFIGAVTGLMAAGLCAIVVWLIATALGAETASPVVNVVAVVFGLAAAGAVGGRLGDPSAFHGSMASMGLAFAVAALALLGGSPAQGPELAGFAALAAATGALAGWLTGLRRRDRGTP